MTIFISGHNFSVELERLCRLFFPDEPIRTVTDADSQKDFRAAVVLRQDGCGGTVDTCLHLDTTDLHHSRAVSEEELKDTEKLNLALADGLFNLLCELTGYRPPWGMLTGVRPAKLLRMLLETMPEEEAHRLFTEGFHCAEDKYRLCRDTIDVEQSILERSRTDSFSLYISIPFCPTRCSYCSFVSQSVEKAARLLPEYVEYLVKEIEFTARQARELGLRLETVYMGGGTPTTLSAEQLSTVLGAVNEHFDMSCVSEFTVEAGRPDTVTPEKLAAIKQQGVRRISINPQTLNDSVLEEIGRRHTAAQVYEAMDMARAAGFDDINMDLIAGLPKDDTASFAATLDGVLSMKPENITVHTLSMKKASTMVTVQSRSSDARGSTAGEMLSICSERLPQSGYHPYYLYRQTRMVGNLENVGWALPGYDGLYNVYIMDETHTILAVGAGGVTKLRQPGVNNIDRVYNFKFPYEYISRFDQILERKGAVNRFYEEFC
ncbi:MAG: coproporphyrinogen dehydrogenase HemZ [Ruminococcaceae bacterium]|nr:coproporphyrinogen dehydrogenase HemZ [Oscillospiraceae bacterium]